MRDAVSKVSVHRGSRALQTLIERAPATGSLALWMTHRDVSSLPVSAPVATDGRVIAYAPAFEALESALQIGWLAHEMLHVAFRHVARREALRRVLGDVDDTLYNACADALVNSTLLHLNWLRLPAGAVHLDTLVQRALRSDLSVDALLMTYDVERLYREIDDRRARAGRSGKSGGHARHTGQGGGHDRVGGTGEAARAARRDAAGSSAESALPGHGGVRADGPRSAAVRALMRHADADLLAGDQDRAEEGAALVREWSERLTRGHASDGTFSILRALGADLPRSRVPWEQVLRSRLNRALAREPEISWSRPARSWLANQGRSRSGRRLPFEPGTVSARQAPRLVLILDVSGSVDDDLLRRLGGQLNAIARRSGACATVIVGDDQVRDVRQFDAAGLSALDLTAWSFDGGGGTDFVPLLEEAARHDPDCVVVLTDLDGPAGSRPPFDVLWVVPAEGPEMPLPFGQRLVID